MDQREEIQFIGKIEKLFERRKRIMNECKETVMVCFKDMSEEQFLKVMERIKATEEKIKSFVNPFMKQTTFGSKDKSGDSPKKKPKIK